MPSLGLPELLIILVILIVVFGVGKLGDIGKSLGRGIREFRQEVGTNNNPNNTTTTTVTRNELPNNNGVQQVEIIEEQRDRVQ